MSYPYDPEIESFLPYAPRLDLSDIPGTRSMMQEMLSVLPPYSPAAGVELVELHVEQSDGPPVELFMLRPDNKETGQKRPLLVWFHGGGFVIGDARESLPFLESVVRETGAVAVSVQYTLAPEATFPAPLDEGRGALSWLVDRADSLGIDREAIAVGGQSAGGAYAAGLALQLRDEGGPQLMFQLLDIPVLDDRATTPSAAEYNDTVVWNSKNAALSWEAYLGGETTDVSPYAAPARAEDLSGLPPAFIAVNQFDPLRDDALEYASRLSHANVPTELHLYPGTFHGSAGIALEAEVSLRQNSDLVSALKRAFENEDSIEESQS